MKRLLSPILVMLVLTTGCLLSPFSNQPPTAYVDLVSPDNAILGETVIFTGHGVDPDGSIGAYLWKSSLDGDLSTEATFKTSSLSQGTHSVWFKVQDDGGQWSKEVLTTVIVVPQAVGKPVINYFDASPGQIVLGGSSTLSWDVSNATTVIIDSQVGNVALSGTRVLLPQKTTTYTLTATSEAGTAKATAEIIVTSLPINAIELYSLPAENGYVTKTGYVGEGAIVGYTVDRVGVQGFLSFDISGVPKDIVIKSVSIDLDTGAVQVKGDPFATLGRFRISKCTYGKLKSVSYFIGPSESLCSFARWPGTCDSSSLTVSALQEQLDLGSDRFQVRMSFEHAQDPEVYNYGNRWAESSKYRDHYLDFSTANPKLTIEYD